LASQSDPKPGTPEPAPQRTGGQAAEVIEQIDELRNAPPAVEQPPPEPTPPTGRRQALKNLRRQLSDDELSSPGAQKLLLDALEAKDAECESLSSYVQRYHEADKRAEVLKEKLKTSAATEIGFGVGVGLGGVLIGLAPTIWSQQPTGGILAAVGVLLMAGGSAMKYFAKTS